MKKNLMTFAAALCCAMTASMFTACGDEDEETQAATTTATSTPTVVAAEITYLVEMKGNGYELCDKSVTYNDENGQATTEAISDTLWTKTVTVQNFPYTCSIQPNYQRNDVEATAESYKFQYYYDVYSITSIYSDGTRKQAYIDYMYQAGYGLTKTAVGGSKADSYISRLIERSTASTKTLSISDGVLQIQ